jgi:predicted MFS family arabinose efflux permease
MSTTRSPAGVAPRLAPHAAVASVGYVVFALAAVPTTLTSRLGIGFGSFGLVVSAALGAFVVSQPLASRLTRRHPTTRLLLWGTLVHAVLAVTLDLATSFRQLVALRALWGLAGGFVLSVGATQIARLYAEDATRYQGVYGGVLTLGGAVGFLAAPPLVELTALLSGGVGGVVHTVGAVAALPAVSLSLRGSGETTPDRTNSTGSSWSVLGHPVVLLAGLAYVAIIGSYVTVSTFVTAYYTELGVVGPLNAFVLLTATVGRALGGVTVGSSLTSDPLLIGGGVAVAAGSFGVLAVGPPAWLVVVLPVVAMLAVSLPFGAIFAVAGRATRVEGTALAFVVAAGNVAALVLPAVTGSLYDVTGGYGAGFALLAVVNAAAVAAALSLHARDV